MDYSRENLLQSILTNIVNIKEKASSLKIKLEYGKMFIKTQKESRKFSMEELEKIDAALENISEQLEGIKKASTIIQDLVNAREELGYGLEN